MLFSKKTMDYLVSGILLFNMIDIVVSIRTIKYGQHIENNPFMKFFMDMDGYMPFVFAKTFLICAGCYFLYKYKTHIIAQVGAYMCFSFYWALIISFYYFLWCK
jgi:hypothetical protein